MADIRCPMCGKLNPDDREVCEFCQARLKPLIIDPEDRDAPLSEAGVPQQPEPQDDDEKIPDWLRSMGEDEPFDEDEESFGEPDEEEDWLGRLQAAGDQFDESEAEDEDEQIDARPSTSELSQRLGRTPTPMASFDEAGEEEEPDWFAGFEDSESDEETSESEPVIGYIPPFDADEEGVRDRDAIPDWLERLQQTDEDDEPADESLPPDARAGALPTFDATFGEGDEEDEAPADDLPGTARYSEIDSPGIPDWLRDMDEDIPESFQRFDEGRPPMPPPAETPFAFDEEPEEEGITPEEPSGLLSRLSGEEHPREEPAPFIEEPASEPEEDDVQLPDWLANLEVEDTVDSGDLAFPGLTEKPESEPAAETDAEPQIDAELQTEAGAAEPDLPDWFNESREAEEEPAAEPEETIEKGVMPDWLSQLKDEEETELGEELEADIEKEDHLPEWLAGIRIDRGEGDGEDEEEGDFPDWLSQIGPPTLEPVEDEPESEELEWLSTLPDASGLDDYEEGAAAFSEPMDDTLAAGEVPDWLQDIEAPTDDTRREYEIPDEEPSKVPALSLDEDEDLSFDEELPEWLSSASLEGRELEEFPALDDDLTPAEMPGWLAAMKPVEVTSADDDLDTGQIENAGPLVGLRSVLPAEPDIARIRKSVSQTIKLQVPEDQLTKASLLEQVLESEGAARPVPREGVITTQQLMRLLIAIIMVGAITAVTFLGTRWIPLPDTSLVPVEVLDASEYVAAVEAETPVLVAFDYEPGANGEMTAAAKPVLEHLMLKGAYLALVSTSPTGPALADQFINGTLADRQYVGGTNYVNLGYIPGGASGLLGFAESPQVFTPFSFEGWDAWATNPVQGVDSLEDFALLLVLTDDPATARYWIEQVEPQAPNTPLVMVTSAQATPLVRPYYQSVTPQVDGLVNGFVGGLQYEQILGTTANGLGRSYWDAFNVGLILAAIAILVGAVINGVARLNRSQPAARPENVEEEAE